MTVLGQEQVYWSTTDPAQDSKGYPTLSNVVNSVDQAVAANLSGLALVALTRNNSPTDADLAKAISIYTDLVSYLTSRQNSTTPTPTPAAYTPTQTVNPLVLCSTCKNYLPNMYEYDICEATCT